MIHTPPSVAVMATEINQSVQTLNRDIVRCNEATIAGLNTSLLKFQSLNRDNPFYPNFHQNTIDCTKTRTYVY